MHFVLVWLSRAAFAGLILFEAANMAGILRFTLDFSWIGLIITAAVVWAALEVTHYLIHREHIRPFYHGFVFLAALTSIYIDALGDILRFYSRFSWYDQVAHFFGGVAAASIVYYLLRALARVERISLRDPWIVYSAFMTASFIGVLYELEEYFEDIVRGYPLRLGDGPDTANDIFLNLIGAAGALLLLELAQTYRIRGGQ